MAYGDIGGLIGVLEFDPGTGIDCFGVHVAGNIWAVVYQGPGSTDWIKTIEISDAGAITDPVKATLNLADGWLSRPHIIKIAANVFVWVRSIYPNAGRLTTLSISDDGLTISVIEELSFIAGDARQPKIVHVAGNVYAIAYYHATAPQVRVCTITIGADGDIGAIQDTINIAASANQHVNIVAVNATIFAVEYHDTTAGTVVATIEIDAAGQITDTVIDTQVIDVVLPTLPQGLVEALPGVFAIAHTGTDLDGFVSTVTISAAGAISGVVDTLEIYALDATELHIIHIGTGICAIAFKKTILLDGNVTTVSIDAAGNIGATVIDTLDFELTNYVSGMILRITGDIYAVFYGGPGNDGFVRTLDISTPPPGGPHHEMLMGMGP